MNSLSPVLRLMCNGLRWLDARWRLFDIQRIRRNPMHPDLPGLLVAERENRP